MKRKLNIIQLLKHSLLFGLLFIATTAFAQNRKPEQSFCIYDATEQVDLYGNELHIVDTDNGRSLQDIGIKLNNLSGDKKVYVTYLRWGQLLLNELLYNRNENKTKSFFQYYDFTHPELCLEPYKGDTYRLADVYSIGEKLNKYLSTEIAEFENNDDAFSKEELAVIVVRYPKLPELFPVEWIENFDPNNDTKDCPLYYTGKLKLSDVNKTLERHIDFEGSTIQIGNELQFTELFDIHGSSHERAVIERYIETCTFENDFQRLAEMYKGNACMQEYITKTLGHKDDNYYKQYRQMPYVFPGKDFQRSLTRRTGFNIERDTLELYRQYTKDAFALSKLGDQLNEVPADTVEFKLDYNLYARYLSNYPSFWAISPLFRKQLPYNNKETYDDTASVKKYYSIRTDVETYQNLRKYIQDGKKLNGNSTELTEGFVPYLYNIRAIYTGNTEYWMSNNIYDQYRNDVDFKTLSSSGDIQYVRRENKGHRVRVNDKKREAFLNIFRNQVLSNDSLFLSNDPIIDTAIFKWNMPEPDKYYRFKHIEYIHDFIHVDTLTDECSCTRKNPLRFLALSLNPAMPDCAPLINGKWREEYKPRSKNDESQSVKREARIEFLQGKWNILPSLGKNQEQLDSLSRAADEIMGRVELEGINIQQNRIDSLVVLGISSPEGTFSGNMALSRRRSESVVNWIKSQCRINSAASAYKDSVSSWQDVADILNKKDSIHWTASSAQSGYYARNKEVEAAMESLRKVQFKFVFTALMEPSEEQVLAIYRTTGNGSYYGAYYYWMLINSEKITHEEKMKLCEEVVKWPKEKFTNTHDVNRAGNDQWMELILPLAANYIAADSIRNKRYDDSILEPYIDINQKGNATSYSHGHLVGGEVPKAYKYVNADFILFNQIQMLLGIGTTESLQRADSLIQILNVTNYSQEFEEKYTPSKLQDVLECYSTKSFLNNEALASRIRETNIVNFYVINTAQAFEALSISGNYSDPIVTEKFKACNDSLGALAKIDDSLIAKYYFRAVTLSRYAEVILNEDRNDMMLDAISSLADLFEANPDMIDICQGDQYIRDIYRNSVLKQKQIDIYLEAVEQYIKRKCNE